MPRPGEGVPGLPNRRGGLLSAAMGVALAAYWLPGAAGPFVPLRTLLGIENRVASPGRVLLTFDDGPHPRGTPAVLESLREHNAKATFFLVGEQVARWPSVAAEIAAAGHEVAVHGYSHRCLLFVSPQRLNDDLRRAEEIIAEATGRRPRRYRPPYGILSTPALVAARQREWEVVLWTRHGFDWSRRATPVSVTRRVTAGVKDGDVMLLHDADHYSAPDSWRTTVAAVPRILGILEQRGLTT